MHLTGEHDELREFREIARRHGNEGATETSVVGLTLHIETDPEVVTYVVYEPLLALIIGGAKRTVLGGHVFEISAGDYVAVSVDLPASGQVLTPPYMAVTLALDLNVLADLMVVSAAAGRDDVAGPQVNRASVELLDPMLRLLRLLDRPEDIAVLSNLIKREILWRLLQGPGGDMVRQIALADSRLSQVNRAITWLRANYDRSVQIDALAHLAGMSAPSFYRHFKAVTAMSPLQYQKQIRLQTARARLVAQPGDVAGVGFSVGYESATQFSREYARQFGAPPGRDAARFREERQSHCAV